MTKPLAVVVLAAGEGTRLRSARTPKVLHGFAGRTLLGHVLAATNGLAAEHTLVVVGHRRDEVTARLVEIEPTATPIVQDVQRGTADAVRLALATLPAGTPGTIVVVPADAPLLTSATLAALVAAHTADGGAAATLLTSVVADATGYGRVVRKGDLVARVVEHADATAAEREISEIATSVYAFEHAALRGALEKVGADNAQGEHYLPDVIGILTAAGATVRAVPAPAAETAGVNDRVQLAAAHRAYNDRVLTAHMRAGVTVIDPATTWVDAGVTLAPDVTVLPSTDLHGSTRVAAGAEIGPFTSLTDTDVGERSRVTRTVAVDSRIGADVTIGPFAYLRPGTELADEVHIGTYVELKKAEIGTGSKVPHLTYVGDATIGKYVNIGAATVFVNYDGVRKHRSIIGDHARTGADNMFVAPVEVGDGAYTAAGSVIVSDVPPGALAVARGRQTNVAGWVERNRPGTPAAEAAARAQEQPNEDEG